MTMTVDLRADDATEQAAEAWDYARWVVHYDEALEQDAAARRLPRVVELERPCPGWRAHVPTPRLSDTAQNWLLGTAGLVVMSLLAAFGPKGGA